MKLLEVEGHVPQCPIAGDATECAGLSRNRSAASVIFTALHGMHTRSSDENFVRPSVCLSICESVTRVNCDKTVQRSVQIYIPYKISFSLVF